MLSQTRYLLPIIMALAVLYGCQSRGGSNDPDPDENITITPTIDFKVLKDYPHDSTLFTEGFSFYKGQLYESTGSPTLRLRSLVVKVNLETGQFEKKIELDNKKYFGEGIVFLNKKLYQLTYKSHTGFIYDASTFRKLGEFGFENEEGWALTTDGKNLIMSDGTDTLTYLDSASLQPIRKLNVTENGFRRDSLNELEYINGFLYANIWLTNRIVKINPSNGQVLGQIDLSTLNVEAVLRNPNADVLNGIAYDSSTDRIYVTGKQWTKIYEIDFAH